MNIPNKGNLDNLLERLEKVGPTGTNEWEACCPAHDDNNPSLKVTLDSNAILLKCWTGCVNEDVVAAIGLKMSDLFLDAPTNPNAKPINKTTQAAPKPPKLPHPPIAPAIAEACHKALRSDDRHLLRVHRLISDEIIDRYQIGKSGQHYTIPIKDEAGEIRDIRKWKVGIPTAPNPKDQKSDWRAWKASTDTRLGTGSGTRLFPVDQLQEHDTIVICEGEPDALALISAGTPAVTNTNGATTSFDKLTKTQLQLFAGKHGIILMDNDEAGIKGALLRTQILQPLMASVRIAHWPEVRSNKWDISDELRKNNGIDTLRDILKGAQAPAEQAPPTPAIEPANTILEPLPPSQAHQDEDQEEEPRHPPHVVDAFPLQAIAGPIRQLVEEGAKANQCAPDLIAIPALMLAGAAAGRCYCLKIKNTWHEYPAIWAAMVSGPGTGKSPALRLAKKPAEQQRQKYFDVYKAELDEWERQRTASEQDRQPLPPKPILKYVYVADITDEALKDLLDKNPKGLALSPDELSGWLKSFGQYKGGGGGDKQSVTSMWSYHCDPVDRKGRDEPIRGGACFLSVAGTIQPDTVQALQKESDGEDGFLDRFLLSYPPSSKASPWTEDEVSAQTINDYNSLFENLYALKFDGNPKDMLFNTEAKNLWITWYNSNSDEQNQQPAHLKGVWSKMPAQCARLIAITHLTRWASDENLDPEVVDKQSVGMAAGLIQYFKSHITKTHDVISEDGEGREIRKVVEWIKTQGNPGIKARDLLAPFRRTIKTAPAAKNLLDKMANLGLGEWREAEQQDRKTGRPPGPKYYIKATA